MVRNFLKDSIGDISMLCRLRLHSTTGLCYVYLRYIFRLVLDEKVEFAKGYMCGNLTI